MKKKLYEKPTIQVVHVNMSQMLCVSGIEDRGDGSFSINAYDNVEEEDLQDGAW